MVDMFLKTCRALEVLLLFFARSIYQGLAVNRLYRNCPLPLEDIRAVGELTTSQLIEAMNKTARPPSSEGMICIGFLQ